MLSSLLAPRSGYLRKFRSIRLPLLSLLSLLPVLAGCQHYNWRHDLPQAETQARQENRYLFIFYKYWLDSTSNRMLSDEVLSDPKVVAMFQQSINVLVDHDFPRPILEAVQKYGVSAYPASVIVAPSGAYQSRTGFLSKDEFMAFARAALQQDAATRTAPGK